MTLEEKATAYDQIEKFFEPVLDWFDMDGILPFNPDMVKFAVAELQSDRHTVLKSYKATRHLWTICIELGNLTKKSNESGYAEELIEQASKIVHQTGAVVMSQKNRNEM